MPFKHIEFIVKGTVHGVGFRYFVKEIARADGLVGWVKNDPVSLPSYLFPHLSEPFRQDMLLEWLRARVPQLINCEYISEALSAVLSPCVVQKEAASRRASSCQSDRR